MEQKATPTQDQTMEPRGARTLEKLHALVDALPTEQWSEAERYLTGLNTDDALLRYFLLAPLDDEPLTDEEIAAV